MSTSISQQKQDLQMQIVKATEKLSGLEEKLRALDKLLVSIAGQRQQYHLLGDICESLDKLSEIGAAGLFWSELQESQDSEQKLQKIKVSVAEFQRKISSVEQSRKSLQSEIEAQLSDIHHLSNRLAGLHDFNRRIKSEYVAVREVRAISYYPVVMPWSKQGEDERRFHIILAIFSLLAITLGILVSVWKLPPPDRDREVVVPERLAQLIKKKREKMPEPKSREKKEEKQADKEEEKPTDKREAKAPSKKSETQQARAKAETKGVLAFKNNIADLMKDSSSAKLGAGTRISNSGKQMDGNTQRRSIIVAQDGSGGIGSSSLGRQGLTNGKKSVASPGLKVARVESGIDADLKEVDRPLSKGLGPSRTDEEIQIVFDRYKSALYRIYNRELRNDPSLRGKMVLRIKIETDGHVSACTVKSSDLASSTLSENIIDRVLKFNFGPKEGIPPVTILYPIDFLPAI